MVEKISLIDGYYAVELAKEDFDPLFQAHVKQVFGANEFIETRRLLSEAETEATARLRTNLGTPFRLNYGIYNDSDEFVGWSFGFQDSAERFYMCNTGVLDGHRRQGLYRALLPRIIDRVAAEGFQILFSRHAMTNNAVIIPKLKAGFVITSFELHDRFGTLVQLSYYTNPARRAVMDYRCGQAALPDAVRQMLERAPDE